VLKFIEKNEISYSEIAKWIKDNFHERNIIITNSKTNKTKKEKTTEDQEKLLNSLEDKNNHIRAIFTVARLTEGWDVLNLFDIVRLNKGQNIGGKHKKTPEATIQEKQLIGRGVRYFPFDYNDKIKNKRKFDDDLKHELRVLEELFYHTYDDPNDKAQHNYVIELKSELKKDGYIKDNRVIKTFKLKKEFQESDFYKNIKVLYNEQVDNPNRKKKTLDDIKENFNFEYKISDLYVNEEEIILDKDKSDRERLKLGKNDSKTITIKFNEIENIFLENIFAELRDKIAPKIGNEFIGDDNTFKTGKEGWKEKFLNEILEKYGFDNIIKAENLKYRLIGLPFFNKDYNSNFKDEYEMLIK